MFQESSLQEKYHMQTQKTSKRSHLGVKLVVAEVQGGVDWLKRLKVDIDFLLLAFLCHNGATVHDQTIGWHWQVRKHQNPIVVIVIVQINKQLIVYVGEARIIKPSQICHCTCCSLGSERLCCDKKAIFTLQIRVTQFRFFSQI